MPKNPDPVIVEVLKKYGFGTDACWDCHGTWVVYHRILEQIAATAGIDWDAPKVLVAEKEAAAILVTGHLVVGEADKNTPPAIRTEWSIGECAVGINYNVKGNQPAYPFAMAEKRAKDRVILKLIGLHGTAYSEAEADEFSGQSDQAAPKASSAHMKRGLEELGPELDKIGSLPALAKNRFNWKMKMDDEHWPEFREEDGNYRYMASEMFADTKARLSLPVADEREPGEEG